MRTEVPAEQSEVLWNDGEFIHSRVTHHADRSSTLLVRSTAAHPTAASLARLEHAYSLRGELNASWAARPIELIDGRGKLALRTEDPGRPGARVATREAVGRRSFPPSGHWPRKRTERIAPAKPRSQGREAFEPPRGRRYGKGLARWLWSHRA